MMMTAMSSCVKLLITKKVLRSFTHDDDSNVQVVDQSKHEDRDNSIPQVSKNDNTSVTIADFASQALIISAIHHHFPNDVIVAEEDTNVLYKRAQEEQQQRQGNGTSTDNINNRVDGTVATVKDVADDDADTDQLDNDLINQIWDLVSSPEIRLGDEECDILTPAPKSKIEMLNLIDLGGKSLAAAPEARNDGNKKDGRVWFIDPIDGTKAFLENGQYVVCVSLLVHGEEKVAAFGCPHLDVDINSLCADHKHEDGQVGKEQDAKLLGESLIQKPVEISETTADTKGPGYLVTAVKYRGAYIRPLSKGNLLPARKIPNIKQPTSPKVEFRVAENCNPTKPPFPDRHKIVEIVPTVSNSKLPNDIKDHPWQWKSIHIYSSQLRYIALSLNACDAVIRTPWGTQDSAPAHIWDHAGGVMIFEEVGGKVTDLNGDKLVFTAGRDLTENFGLIAASREYHERLVEGARSVFGEVRN